MLMLKSFVLLEERKALTLIFLSSLDESLFLEGNRRQRFCKPRTEIA